MSSLDDIARLGSKPGRIPDDQVGKLAHLDASHQVTEALSNGRVDGILAHVTLDTSVVSPRALILGQPTPLDLVLVRRVPGPEHHLAAATHGLRVGAHHADGA